jgi:hypothetical protein
MANQPGAECRGFRFQHRLFSAEMATLLLVGDLLSQPLAIWSCEGLEFHLGHNELFTLRAHEIELRLRFSIASCIGMPQPAVVFENHRRMVVQEFRFFFNREAVPEASAGGVNLEPKTQVWIADAVVRLLGRSQAFDKGDFTLEQGRGDASRSCCNVRPRFVCAIPSRAAISEVFEAPRPTASSTERGLRPAIRSSRRIRTGSSSRNAERPKKSSSARSNAIAPASTNSQYFGMPPTSA